MILLRAAVVAIVAGIVAMGAAVPASGAPSGPDAAPAAKGKKKGKGKKCKGKKKGKKGKKCKQQKKKKGNKPGAASPTREAIFVGNNWDGTADVLLFDPGTKGSKGSKKVRCKGKKTKAKRKQCKRNAKKKSRKRAKKHKKGKKNKKQVKARQPDLKRVARLNIIPDASARMAEIALNPIDLGYFIAIQQLIGEGHNQYVDDMYSTNDGKHLIVSRPSFKDVVSLNIATGKIVWRFEVDGQRSDHMALSPDGRHVAVSASTGNVVHILDTATGAEVGGFPSGDSPHENTYSADGKRIYHASIGLVYTPADLPIFDTTKGDRYFQVVDAGTNAILSQVDMGQKLAEAGYPGMSAAVRPMAITSDERFAYLQVSFFHGYVKYDLANQKVVQVVNLPISDKAAQTPRELYLLDSAHHGIALDKTDSKLCVAGTMSDYAAIVPVNDPSKRTIINEGEKPYWSTTSRDGEYCFVSWSGTDKISILSYAEQREVLSIKVGDHPQRIRTGEVEQSWLKSLGAG